MLTGEQFDRTRRLALKLAGIELLERHRELLQRRSRRIEILSPASLDARGRATGLKNGLACAL